MSTTTTPTTPAAKPSATPSPLSMAKWALKDAQDNIAHFEKNSWGYTQEELLNLRQVLEQELQQAREKLLAEKARHLAPR